MQLIHNNTKIELNRDHTAFTAILEKVNEMIEKDKVIFSHLVIDDIDVYEDHEAYINERVNEIMQIEIITRTANEMIWETMESVHSYLERAIPALQELVDNSYDGFKQETWTGLEQLTEGMQFMLQFVEFTRQADKQPSNWDKADESFKNCETYFGELLGATEARDTVLISDLLAYEIVPAYQDFEKQIAISLQDKGFQNYVN